MVWHTTKRHWIIPDVNVYVNKVLDFDHTLIEIVAPKFLRPLNLSVWKFKLYFILKLFVGKSYVKITMSNETSS